MESNLSTQTNKPTNQPQTAEFTDKSKSNKPLIVTTAITSILALAGIAAGIYFFLDSNTKSTEISTLNSKIDALQAKIDATETTNDTSEVSNLSEEEVLSMVAEYIIGNRANCSFSVIESGLDNLATKVFISFNNAPDFQMEYEGSAKYISYANLNQEYKKLFGSNLEDLPKQDFYAYLPGKGDALIYDNDRYRFDELMAGCGQTFTDYQVKSYKTNQNGNLVVDIAYLEAKFNEDTQNWEVTLADGESISFPSFDNTEQSAKEQEDAATKMLNQYASKLSNYEMVFTKDNLGNYILASISKTN